MSSAAQSSSGSSSGSSSQQRGADMFQPSSRLSAPTSSVMPDSGGNNRERASQKEEHRHRVGRKRSADEMDGASGSFASSSSSRRNSYPSVKEESPEPTSGDDSNSTSASLSGSNFASPGSSGMMVLSRDMRNKAEKLRRDKLNNHILRLGDLLPTVNMAPKRMDKTSVLRLASNFLRCQRSIHNPMKGTKPQEWPDSAKVEGLLENFEGFLLVVTGSGKILYVSEAVEKMFGHSQVDLLGNFIFTILHQDDAKNVAFSLRPSPGNNDQREYRKFCCRIAERSLSRSEPCRYVYMCVSGLLRHMTDVPTGQPAETDQNTPTSACSSSQADRIPLSFLPSAFGRNAERSLPAYAQPDDWMFSAIVTPVRSTSIVELSLYQATQDEYFTRHCLDGRIINVDQRISIVAGYTVSEVIGHSGFAYVVDDDKAMTAVLHHDMLYSSRDGSVVVTYRLRSKSNGFIFLRTKGFLEFNRMSGTCESFICINTLISAADGMSDLRKQVEQYRNQRPVPAAEVFGPRYNPGRGWFGPYSGGAPQNGAFPHGAGGGFAPGLFPSGMAVAAAAAAASFGASGPFQISPSSLGPFSTHSPTLSVPLAVPIRHRHVQGPPRFTVEMFKDDDYPIPGGSNGASGGFTNGFANSQNSSAMANGHGFAGSGNAAFGLAPEHSEAHSWPSAAAQAPSAEPANVSNGGSFGAMAPVDGRLVRYVGPEEQKNQQMMPNLNPLPQGFQRDQGPNMDGYEGSSNRAPAQMFNHGQVVSAGAPMQQPGPMSGVGQMGPSMSSSFDQDKNKIQNGQYLQQIMYGSQQQSGGAYITHWNKANEGPWGQQDGGPRYSSNENLVGTSYNQGNLGDMSTGQSVMNSAGGQNYDQQTSGHQYNLAGNNHVGLYDYDKTIYNGISPVVNGVEASQDNQAYVQPVGPTEGTSSGLSWSTAGTSNNTNGSINGVSYSGLIMNNSCAKNDSVFLGSVADGCNNMAALGTTHHPNNPWELKCGPHR